MKKGHYVSRGNSVGCNSVYYVFKSLVSVVLVNCEQEEKFSNEFWG